jgi:hypothetical protein
MACVLRVAAVAKAFRGDIFGEFVHGGTVTGGYASVRTVWCRLPPDAAPFFAQVLRMDYDVAVEPDSAGSSPPVRWTSTYTVRAAGSSPGVRVLVVWTPRSGTWRTFMASLDVDLIAVDSDRLYVRTVTKAMRGITDRLGHLLARVAARRFCLTDEAPSIDTGAAMRRAAALVADGWKMDDALVPGGGWVVAEWDAVLRDPASLRRADPGRGHPSEHDVCALCQEAFKPSHVVANLACNHNFHAVSCPHDGGGSGLSAWLDAHDTCPCCRGKT